MYHVLGSWLNPTVDSSWKDIMSGGGYFHPDILAAIGHFTVQTHLGQQGSHLLGTEAEGRKEMFYLTTYSTHFIYDYMASNIW